MDRWAKLKSSRGCQVSEYFARAETKRSKLSVDQSSKKVHRTWSMCIHSGGHNSLNVRSAAKRYSWFSRTKPERLSSKSESFGNRKRVLRVVQCLVCKISYNNVTMCPFKIKSTETEEQRKVNFIETWNIGTFTGPPENVYKWSGCERQRYENHLCQQ